MLLLVAVVPGADRARAASDLALYLDRGGLVLAGAVPYRDFAFEYPPLALVAMVVPRLLTPFGAPDLATFAWCFSACEGLLAVAIGWLVGRVTGRSTPAAVVWTAIVLVALPSVAWRFDLWPAALVLVALVAADRGRPAIAGAALGIGTMMKLFPAVVLPILVARSLVVGDRRGVARLTLAFALVTGAVLAVAYALAGPASFGWLEYLAARGLQLESAGASVLLVLHAIAGLPASVGDGYGSLQLTADGASLFVAASPVLQLVLPALTWVLALRAFRARVAAGQAIALPAVAAATAASIIALLVASKVFSVQYIVWLLPLAALLPRRAAVGMLIAAALSTVIHPLGYGYLMNLEPAMVAVLAARNALLVGIGLSLVGLRGGRRLRWPHGATALGSGRTRAGVRHRRRHGPGPDPRAPVREAGLAPAEPAPASARRAPCPTRACREYRGRRPACTPAETCRGARSRGRLGLGTLAGAGLAPASAGGDRVDQKTR